jgi:hypothetical protein
MFTETFLLHFLSSLLSTAVEINRKNVLKGLFLHIYKRLEVLVGFDALTFVFLIKKYLFRLSNFLQSETFPCP